MRQLERVLKAHSVALLSGDTGVGKTELALGLCRWFLKPARVAYPGGVFYTAFEASHPAGIERVVHEIGTAVAGLDFADMPAEQQRRWVTAYLQQNPSLLVWDNVENVAGFPDGSPGLLDETELPDLAAFPGGGYDGAGGNGRAAAESARGRGMGDGSAYFAHAGGPYRVGSAGVRGICHGQSGGSGDAGGSRFLGS